MTTIEHDYVFEDTRVDRSTLLDETNEALERYNFEYSENPYRYFTELGSNIWSYFEKDSHRLLGRRDGANMLYAKISDHEDSRSEAFIWHGSWAQSVAPRTSTDEILRQIEFDEGVGADTNSWNKLILADFMHFTLKNAGVRDQDGDTLPVISLPSPSLDRHGLMKKTRGVQPLGKLAMTAIDLCHVEGFESVRVGGVSQGAATMAEFVRRGGRQLRSIKSAFLGELPNAQIRSMPRFALAYLMDGKNIQGDYTEDGPLPRSQIVKGGENSRMLAQIAGRNNLLTNLRLVKDMSRGELVNSLDSFLSHEIPTTIEYGLDSEVSSGTDSLLYQPALCQLKHKGLLQLLRAKNAPHIHSEHIVQTVDAVLRSARLSQKTS